MIQFDELLTEIKKRNEVKTEQAHLLLTMAALPGESENRLSFLRLAQRHLPDNQVFEKWVELTLVETDDLIKKHLLQSLASFCHSGELQAFQGEHLLKHLDALAALIEQESLREAVLNILSALLDFDGTQVGDKLAGLYTASDSESFKWVIFGLIYWIRNTWDQAPQFLLDHFDDTPQRYRPGILHYLLKRKAVPVSDQIRLLGFIPEYDYARLTLTEFLMDSTTALDPALEAPLVRVLAEDPVVECRINAARVLIRNGRGLTEALEQLKTADEPEVRSVIFQELAAANTSGNDFLQSLLQFLGKEKNATLFEEILHHLAPKVCDHSDFGQAVRTELLKLTYQNISVHLAGLIFSTLGTALKAFPDLRQSFVEVYAQQNQDELRATILESLAIYAASDDAIRELIGAGLTSKSSLVRNAALKGVLSLSVLAPFFPLILQATPLLTDKEMAPGLRERLAGKIASVGQYPDAVRKRIQEAIPFFEDARLRKKLDDSLSNSRDMAKNSEEPEWDTWLRKITQESSVKGIFPFIYASFDQYPEKSREIFDAMLINEVADPFPIFEFLSNKGLADEKLLKWVWDYLITEEDYYGRETRRCLAILKTSEKAKIRKQDLWKLLEKEKSIYNCGTVILLDTIFILYGGETLFVEELLRRIEQVESPRLFSNYVKLLQSSTSFLWAKECIELLAQRLHSHPLLAGNSEQQVNELVEMLDITLFPAAHNPTTALSQPGLLDD